MDHVIPFSDGGAEGPANLLLACHDCNRKKSDRTPVEWFIGMDPRLRWGGKGTPQAGATYKDLGLRERYMSVHGEGVALLHDLDRVAAEIAFPEAPGSGVAPQQNAYPLAGEAGGHRVVGLADVDPAGPGVKVMPHSKSSVGSGARSSASEARIGSVRRAVPGPRRTVGRRRPPHVWATASWKAITVASPATATSITSSPGSATCASWIGSTPVCRRPAAARFCSRTRFPRSSQSPQRMAMRYAYRP
jgi:Uncharacterized protein conserved in bacteria